MVGLFSSIVADNAKPQERPPFLLRIQQEALEKLKDAPDKVPVYLKTCTMSLVIGIIYIVSIMMMNSKPTYTVMYVCLFICASILDQRQFGSGIQFVW